MNYLIDFDFLTVECKTEESESVNKYIDDNNLRLALALIHNEDELVIRFTLQEIIELYNNINPANHKPNMADEDHAARLCWGLIENMQDDFPTFTVAFGKKLAKGSEKSTKGTPEISSHKSEKSVPTKRISLNKDDVLVVVDGKCKQGSILSTIVTAIDEEFCETVGEVLDYIVANHIIPKTGDLADIKFAEHNVKYFLKQGKIYTDIL